MLRLVETTQPRSDLMGDRMLLLLAFIESRKIFESKMLAHSISPVNSLKQNQ
jgi:hypothetical protein